LQAADKSNSIESAKNAKNQKGTVKGTKTILNNNINFLVYAKFTNTQAPKKKIMFFLGAFKISCWDCLFSGILQAGCFYLRHSERR